MQPPRNEETGENNLTKLMRNLSRSLAPSIFDKVSAVYGDEIEGKQNTITRQRKARLVGQEGEAIAQQNNGNLSDH